MAKRKHCRHAQTLGRAEETKRCRFHIYLSETAKHLANNMSLVNIIYCVISSIRTFYVAKLSKDGLESEKIKFAQKYLESYQSSYLKFMFNWPFIIARLI